MTLVRTSILLLGALACSTVSGTLSAWEIVLSDTHVTRESVVWLSDIADVRGLDDDDELKANLEGIRVAVGPTPTHPRELSSSDVRRVLELHGVDWSQGYITGASRVTITCGDSEPKALTKAILRRREPTAKLRRDLEQVARTSVKTVEYSRPATSRKSRSKEQPIVVAVRDLSKGQLIREADVAVVYVPEKQLLAGAFSCLEDVVGLEATCPVRIDETLTDRMLKKPVLVRNRDLVEVGVCCGGIVVTKQAIAQGDGGKGDTVVVCPVDNKKTRLNALVVDVRKVRVLAESMGPID